MSSTQPIPHMLAVYSSKGGSGKSTTASNVAAGLVSRGYSVLVLDMDPQLSIRHLSARAHEKAQALPFRVLEDWPNDMPTEDFIVLDHSPRTGENDRPPIEIDVMLVPVAPGAADMDSLVQAHEVIGSYEAKSIFFWSRMDNRSNTDKDFIKAQEQAIGEKWLTIPMMSSVRGAFNDAETVYSNQNAICARAHLMISWSMLH